MSSLSQVIKHQRQTKGKGILGSITTAVAQKTLEKIDPRNYLVDRDGLLASLFSGLRGYKPTTYRTPSGMGVNKGYGKLESKISSVIERLDNIQTTENIISKNTLSLPKIEKDISEMKREVVKLIGVMKESLPKSSEEYKRLVQEQEDKFEQSFEDKNKDISKTTPQKIKSEKDDSLLSKILTPTLIAGIPLLMGGIVSGFFKSPEFQTVVEEVKKGFGDGIIEPLKKSIFGDGGEGIESFVSKHWMEIAGLTGLLIALVNPIKTIKGLVIGLGSGLGLLSKGVGRLGAALTNPLGLVAGLTATGLYVGWKNTDYSKHEASGDTGIFFDPSQKEPPKATPEEQYKFEEYYLNDLKKQLENKESKLKDLQESKANPQYIRGVERSIDELKGKIQEKEKLKEITPPPLPPDKNEKNESTIEPVKVVKDALSKFFDSSAHAATIPSASAEDIKDSEKINSPVRAKSGNDYIDFFVSRGWTKEQAAGILGNLLEESGLNPKALNKKENAQGIAQWRNERLEYFANRYGKGVLNSSIHEQLDFVDWELKNTEKKAGSYLKQTKNIEEATRAFDKYYERSYLGAKGLTAKARIDKAKGAFSGNMKFNENPPEELIASNSSPAPATINSEMSLETPSETLTLGSSIKKLFASSSKGLNAELLNKMWGKPGTRRQIEEKQNEISINKGEDKPPVIVMPQMNQNYPEKSQQISMPIASVVDEDFIKKLVDTSLLSMT